MTANEDEDATPPTIRTPWTMERVEQLNRYQALGLMHPYTCKNGCGNLTAYVTGWVCVECGYHQTWAHAWTADKASLDQLESTMEPFLRGSPDA